MQVRNGLRIRFRVGKSKKKTLKIAPSRIFVYIFVALLVIFTSLPLVYVVSTAFKPINELLRFPPIFLVRRPVLTNFRDLLFAVGSTSVPFLRYVVNSAFVSAVTVFFTVLISSLGAYSLVKLDLPFKGFFFSLIIAALMFPTQVTTIPNYLVVSGLGLTNTYWSLIVPKVAGAFGFFLVKQFCHQMPDALLEAARIDGARELKIFTRIVFPFMKPAYSTLIVFAFIASWNDSFAPLVYITNEAMRTLPLALQSIGSGGTIARAGAMAAATLLTTIPTVLIYTLMQRRVISTMAHSGIK